MFCDDCIEFNEKCKLFQGLQDLKHFPFKNTIHLLSRFEAPSISETRADPDGNVGRRIAHARKGTFGAGCRNVSIIKMHSRDSGLTFPLSAKRILQSFN